MGAQRDALESHIPMGLRVCILGSCISDDACTKSFVRELAKGCASRLAEHVVFITGGMPGVQEEFARGLGDDFNGELLHLLPKGWSSDFGIGVDLVAGATLSQRTALLGNIAYLYVCIGGGPGTAREAKLAFGNGACVLPIISAGGASSGMFGFPVEALEKPSQVSVEQWELIAHKAPPDTAAAAVVDILQSSRTLFMLHSGAATVTNAAAIFDATVVEY